MSKGLTRAERLRKLEELYYTRAYSDIEMAEHLSRLYGDKVDRTTIYRDRILMEGDLGIPFIEEDAKFRINRSKYISSIRVNHAEALSLYLALRRATQQTRYAQKHAAGVLEKLALILHQSLAQRLVKVADEILSHQVDRSRVEIFEMVTRAWVDGQPIYVTYRGLEASEAQQHRFHIYLIEPAPWSDSVYLIGYSERFESVTTLKLERIERASLSNGSLNALPEFDEKVMLQHAWGIWSNKRKPALVRLKFTAGRATRRVKESIWHPLEKVEDIEDGGCIWQAEIAEPKEMLPFIRSWGSDCLVLEPKWLREEMMGETRAMAMTYGWHVSSQPNEEINHNQSTTLDDFFGE